MLFWCLWMDVGQLYPYCHQAMRQYHKSSIKHPIGAYLFQTRLGGGGLIETGGLFNLAKTLVSVLHKELECKEEKLKCKKLEVMQRRIKKTNPNFHPVNNHPNKLRSVHTKFYNRDWLIQSIIYQWRTIISGTGVGGGLINFFPW